MEERQKGAGQGETCAPDLKPDRPTIGFHHERVAKHSGGKKKFNREKRCAQVEVNR